MFYCCYDSIVKDLAYQKDMQAHYKTMLRRYRDYDGWQLRRHKSHDKGFYYAVRNLHGNVERVSLGPRENPHVENLCTKYYLEKALKRIELNIRLLEKTLSQYRSINPNIMRDFFPKTYQFTNPEIFRTAGVIDQKAWGMKVFCENAFHAGGLQQITARGEKVRSKSEVIIANALLGAGIDYQYEKPLQIDGITWRPDFTLLVAAGTREIYWEHFGLMKDADYRQRYTHKIETYAGQGLYVGRDIVVTYDDEWGRIDASEVTRWIEFLQS